MVGIIEKQRLVIISEVLSPIYLFFFSFIFILILSINTELAGWNLGPILQVVLYYF